VVRKGNRSPEWWWLKDKEGKSPRKYACLGGLDSSFREKLQMVMTHGEYEQIFTSKEFQTSKKKMGKGKWV